MTDLPLTQDEYNVLLPMRDSMRKLVTSPGEDVPAPDFQWWQRMSPIYQRIYGAPKPSMACPPCIIDVLKKLWLKLLQHEEAQAGQ